MAAQCTDLAVKHISLDRESKAVKKFVRALPVDPDGSVLELEGQPLLRVLPVSKETVDKVKLKAAILKRRDRSRRLNQDWETIDQETWERPAPLEE